MTKKKSRSPKLHGIVIRRIYVKVMIGFMAAVGLLVILIAVVAFSSTTITVTPELAVHTADGTVSVSRTASDETAGSIKAELYATTITVTTVYEGLTATASEPAKATGTIRIFNNYSRVQPLVATTRLLSDDGHLFRTTEFVEVPVGGSVDVPVIADQPGKEFEIGPDHFILPAIWPGIQDKIYGQSTTAMTGGERSITVVSEEDIAKAKEQADAAIAEQAQQAIRDEILSSGSTKQLLPDALRLSLLNETVSAAVGQSVDAITIQQQVRVEAAIFDESDFLSHAHEVLAADLESTDELATVDEASLRYELLSFDGSAGTAELTFSLSGTTRPTLDQPALSPNRFTGKSQRQIEQIAKAVPGVKAVTVRIGPLWSFRSSASAERITVQLATDN